MIEQIQAGDTFSYKVNYPDYPASSGWACSMLLRGVGSYSISSTPSDGDFLLSAAVTATALYTAGKYKYFVYVSKGTERYLVESGSVEILADYSSIPAATDIRSWAEKALEAVEARIMNRATHDQLKYQIAGRTIEKIPLPELIALRDRLKNEIAREKNAERIKNGLGAGNKIYLRF